MAERVPKEKVLDVTCGARTIWFNKHHPAAIYCDKRREEYSDITVEKRAELSGRVS